MSADLTSEECSALIDIINGTIDSMDDFTNDDFPLWIGILRKLGPDAIPHIKEWLEEAAAETE